MPTHECCRSHGGVRALEAQSGKTLWTWHSTPPAEPAGKSAAGVQRWGPSGASVWSTPTVNAKRGLIYVGTGQNFSHPATATSDAVIALGIEDGTPRWQFQALADDVWNGACQLDGPTAPRIPARLGHRRLRGAEHLARGTRHAAGGTEIRRDVCARPRRARQGAVAQAPQPGHAERRQQRHPLGHGQRRRARVRAGLRSRAHAARLHAAPGSTPCVSPTAACCGSTRSRAAARSIRPMCRWRDSPRCARARRPRRARRGRPVPSSTRIPPPRCWPTTWSTRWTRRQAARAGCRDGTGARCSRPPAPSTA